MSSCQWGVGGSSWACEVGGPAPLMALPFPHQIGQAIEEVNSNNQELLRKYRRELQLRKKCHNELVRLKGDCRLDWGVPSRGGPDLLRGCSCPSLWPPVPVLGAVPCHSEALL